MKRIILMVIKYLYIVPFWILKISKYGKSEKYSEEQRYGLLHKITTKVNRAGRVTIQSHGSENLPEKNGYILFPNHQGLFDVLIFLESHERPFRFVIKKELENTFLLKQIIRLLNAQTIDRDDIRQSMKVIMQMTKEVKEGHNYIIFAEGTRSKNNSLLDFKGGSFKSAINAKCPIVPVAIIDSYKAFDTSSIKKLTVQIFYLKPLYYDEYKDMNSIEIASYVRTEIRKKIEEFLKEKSKNELTNI